MADNEHDDLEIIEQLRARNNINWMDILRIALKRAPEETKEVLRRIRALDIDISYHTQRIAEDADSETQNRAEQSAVSYRRVGR